MSIFDQLQNSQSCYCVVVYFVFTKGVTQAQEKEYILLAKNTDKKKLINMDFYYLKKSTVWMRKLSQREIDLFKGISERYRLVLSNSDGRVYEQPKRSFKELYDAQKEAVDAD